jgi:hypothetical protein
VIWAGGRLRRLALAICVAYGAGIGAETLAAGPPFGSRNFTPPSHVPNYFSNESGPFRGGGGGQTASPVVAAPGPAGSVAVASGRLARQQSVHAGRKRARLARGKSGRHGHLVHAQSSKGGKAVMARSASVRKKAGTAAGRTSPAKAKGHKAPNGKSQRIARARG